MNKSELVNSVVEAVGLTKKQATEAVNSIIASVQGTLAEGGTVKLQGFGTFRVTKRNERKGRNPQTGAEITIKERNVPTFKASNSMKANFNK